MTWYGSQDEAVHLWRYKGNYSAHKFSNSSKAKSLDEDYTKFREERGKMLVNRRNDLVFEFGFCPQISNFKAQQDQSIIDGKFDSNSNMVYEFRQYELKPGRLSDWNGQWNKVFQSKIRGHDNDFVGGFFTDIGKLNTIYYIWAYPSLEDRKNMRDKAWMHDDWASVVTETQDCCESMSSQIMLPMMHSPLQ